VVELLREQGVADFLVTAGGTIPEDDAQELKARGVAEVFTSGASTDQIIAFIRGGVTDASRRSANPWVQSSASTSIRIASSVAATS
jgi:methylmalonyl-CoA mutase cobalamin-binding domain/chain